MTCIKVYIVVMDETDYNGDRTYPKVFTDKDMADVYCSSQLQHHKNDAQSIANHWVPRFYIEESILV